jgi:type I restriction enzyme M protein
MAASRKNEAQSDIELYNFLASTKRFCNKWTAKKTENIYVQEVLDISSKKNSGQRGEPDLIYLNETKRLLVLIENKDSIKDHVSKSEDNPVGYAVDGIKHYLSFFLASKLFKQKATLKEYFENWSIIGIAVSGDINNEYNHLISTYIISNGEIKDIETNEILNEDDYLAFFENIDIESISKNISVSSGEINKMLRTLDSHQRPILLSALMICLYDRDNVINDFKKGYSNWTAQTIALNIPNTIRQILNAEGIDSDKINVLINELAFINTDNDLRSSNILKEILKELEDNVIPLFNKKANYDIIGKFYEEFLRYAGVANVKKGIVLTPSHITKLFTELVDIKTNDVIFDSCCGTGSFLIAGMNRLISEIENSNIANKQDKIKTLKETQLIGFEKSTTMYSLAISNMLFRGDGKSRIYNIDSFSETARSILEKLKREGVSATIGFINPPYGGRDSKENPTKKEIQFLESLLDNVSRYGIIIAPLSTYFKEDDIRKRILSKHTLKYVINAPGELFQPNASIHTAIAVFETNSPHSNKEVVFFNLADDGFILSKNRGRTDVLNKWNPIKKSLFEKIQNPVKYQDNYKLLKTIISAKDEWIIQAHSKTDYSHITKNSFVISIKQYLIFSLKHKFDLVDKEIDEISLLEILGDSINKEPFTENIDYEFDIAKWKEFSFPEVFIFNRGKRLKTLDQIPGDIAYISSTKLNNGIDNYITPPDGMTLYNNCLTLNNSGSVGYVFYHTYDFVISDHCTVIYPKDKRIKLNQYLYAFLKPIIESLKPKYNFAREISDSRLMKEKISLPANRSGNPDWKYMEDLIKSLPYSSSM